MHSELKVVGEELWKRIGESMDRVELRLRKVVSILESTSIPFAVVGGNADLTLGATCSHEAQFVSTQRPGSRLRHDRCRTCR